MNLFQNLKREQTGSAVTGFALILPLVVVLTLIIVQFIFIAINYASISLSVDKLTRFARMGYSDHQIISKFKNEVQNVSLLSSEPGIEIKNINLKNHNLKIMQVYINYELFGYSAFKISSKNYVF